MLVAVFLLWQHSNAMSKEQNAAIILWHWWQCCCGGNAMWQQQGDQELPWAALPLLHATTRLIVLFVFLVDGTITMSSFCFAPVACDTPVACDNQHVQQCQGFFMPWHWHMSCHGIGSAAALATAFHRAGCCILRRRGIATFRNAATPATFWMIPFSLRKAAQATPLSRGSFILFFYITMPLSGAPQLEVSFSSPESGAADTPFWKFLCFF